MEGKMKEEVEGGNICPWNRKNCGGPTFHYPRNVVFWPNFLAMYGDSKKCILDFDENENIFGQKMKLRATINGSSNHFVAWIKAAGKILFMDGCFHLVRASIFDEDADKEKIYTMNESFYAMVTFYEVLEAEVDASIVLEQEVLQNDKSDKTITVGSVQEKLQYEIYSQNIIIDKNTQNKTNISGSNGKKENKGYNQRMSWSYIQGVL
jgi:hypothetical protein